MLYDTKQMNSKYFNLPARTHLPETTDAQKAHIDYQWWKEICLVVCGKGIRLVPRVVY